MPSQELHLEKEGGSRRFSSTEKHDTGFTKEAFAAMDEGAFEHLSESLSISKDYPADEMPTSPDGLADLVWEAMYGSANEFGQTKSYFIVRRTSPSGEDFFYVSGDWPSAESYVNLVAVG